MPGERKGLPKEIRRLDPRRAEEVRQRIRVSAIVFRLQGFIFEPDKYPMTQNQLSAAKLLLNKALPDLTHVKVEGPGMAGEFLHQHVVVREFIDAQPDLPELPDGKKSEK